MKLFGLLLAVSLLAMGNSASAQSDMPKPGSSEPMVSIVTAAGVSVSLTFQGDYGPNRMEGTLVSLPDEPIRAREGKQVREIPLRHLQELQRTPLGIGPDALSTYSLQMFTGESYILQPDKSEPPAGPQPPTITRTLQVVSVPQGAVELKTALFGVMRIPFPKLLQLTVQPFRGALREVPRISLPVQVLDNLTLQVPFQRITSFRRDPMGGTTTVSFGNAEGATGRVKEMPAGALVVRTTDGEERRIPLSEVVQYNVEGLVNGMAR